MIKCLRGLCKSWLCNRTQCITAGGKRSSSCYRGTKTPCVKCLLFVLVVLGSWRAVVLAAFQPVTPELADVLWPVSCFGYGIGVLSSAVAVCDCKGLGSHLYFPNNFKKVKSRSDCSWQAGRFCWVTAHPPDRAARAGQLCCGVSKKCKDHAVTPPSPTAM